MPAAELLRQNAAARLRASTFFSPLDSLLAGNVGPYVHNPERVHRAFARCMGLMPLHAAAAANDTEAMRLLLALGAPINAGDDDGNTALHFAVLAGHADAVSLLVRTGANPDAVNVVHTTPLHDLARFGGDTITRQAILTVLVRRGVNMLVKNAYGNTAAHRAVFHGNHAMADAFVRIAPALGAMENARGFTPLDLAYGMQDFSMIQTLRRRGAVHGSAWAKNLTIHASDLSEWHGWHAFQRTAPHTASRCAAPP